MNSRKRRELIQAHEMQTGTDPYEEPRPIGAGWYAGSEGYTHTTWERGDYRPLSVALAGGMLRDVMQERGVSLRDLTDAIGTDDWPCLSAVGHWHTGRHCPRPGSRERRALVGWLLDT